VKEKARGQHTAGPDSQRMDGRIKPDHSTGTQKEITQSNHKDKEKDTRVNWRNGGKREKGGRPGEGHGLLG